MLPTIRNRAAGTMLTVAVAAALTVTSCSSSSRSTGSTGTTGGGGSAPPASAGAAVTVHVKNFSFDPGTVTVHSGATVTWVFDDSAKHNVTASDKGFKSADLSSGGTYRYTFHTAGTYSYICSIHQYMTGKVVVE